MNIKNIAKGHHLTDTNQSFWQLAAIQLTGVTSLPVLFTSVLIIENNSFKNSIFILLAANLFLWLIRLGLIAMSHRGKKSVIDIAKDYFENIWGFGNWGLYCIAALLLLSTLFLFVEETTIVSSVLTKRFSIDEGPNIDPFMQISVVIGILSTLFCTWGMTALRWLATISLPIIIGSFAALLIYISPSADLSQARPLSLAALPLFLGINLAVTADLPTFFRHSKSWKSSFHALTTLQLVSLVLGIGGLFLGVLVKPFSMEQSAIGPIFQNFTIKMAFVLLVALSSICSNVSNVYSSSVGWEVVVPSSLVGKKEYLILGLLITMIYISITGIISLETPVNITNASLVNLSFVFIIGYITSSFGKYQIGQYERNAFFLAWIVPTLLNTLQYLGVFLPETSTLLVGIGSIISIMGISWVVKNFAKPN